MLYQEVTITKSPQYRNTWQSRVSCCLNIHVTISHVNSPAFINTKLTQSCKDRIRSRFLTNTLRFMLTNGNLDSIREEMPTEFYCCSHHLITHNSQSASFCL